MTTQDTPQRLDSWGATAATLFREPLFLWVELTRDPSTLFHDLCDLYPGRRISDHERLPMAVEDLSPAFICFTTTREEAICACSQRPALTTRTCRSSC